MQTHFFFQGVVAKYKTTFSIRLTGLLIGIRLGSALTELGLLDKLLSQFNKQLSRHHISIRKGVLVDASLVDTPHKPNGKISLTNGQGIVQKVITTTANRSETKEFIPLLEGANIPQGTAGLADKGYCP